MLNETTVLLLLSLSIVIQAEVSFIEQPSNMEVRPGQTVVFKCRVTGSDPTTDIVSWIIIHDGGNTFIVGPTHPVVDHDIATRYNITGDPAEGHYDLQITNVEESDSGGYTCLVTTLASSSARLQVITPRPPGDEYPRCYSDDVSGAVYIGQYVSVTCESKGGYPLPVLTWNRDGESIYGVFTPDPYPKHVYHWRITEDDDGKLLTCMSISPEMSTPRSCTVGPLKVLPTTGIPLPTTTLRAVSRSPGSVYPTLTTTQAHSNGYTVKVEPTVNDVSRDEDVMFTCFVLGGSERFDGLFTWKIDRVPVQILPDTARYKLENDNRTLRFKAKSSDDSSIIYCEISGQADVLYASALIRVHGDEINPSSPSRISIIIGMTVGGVVVIILFIVAFLVFTRYKRPQKKKETDSDSANGMVVRSPDGTILGSAPLNAANENELHELDWKMFRDQGPDIMLRNPRGKTLYVYQNNSFPTESYS